ncbi:MAG: SpoIIE family protein phosphatase [Chloroflexota bacterium]
MSLFSTIQQWVGTTKTNNANIKRTEKPETSTVIQESVQIAANDPLMAYLLTNPNIFDVYALKLKSSALTKMREAGVQMAVPLVSQGELIGLISLGKRLSDQAYSIDDKQFLRSLAAQAAPAMRSAQLIQQQKAEAAERERMEQQLKVARVIQQTLLPSKVPVLEGWQMDVYWQPAYSVGGDFYDFIPLEDGRMCIIAADVTDKGIPAALVMASARSILRAATEHLQSPGAILNRVNNTLCPDIPDKMFITCLCIILDPKTGFMHIANAGHNLPYLRRNGEVLELKATGMPLGLLPNMPYDEVDFQILPGDTMLLFSDGIDEAHNPQREMFGFDRLRALVRDHKDGTTLIERLLDELRAFTGPHWEQEDDVTFVLINCNVDNPMSDPNDSTKNQDKLLGEIQIPSQEGNEILAMNKVVKLIEALPFPAERIQQLQTAVAEATMNAMEHGNEYDAETPVIIRVYHTATSLTIRILDKSQESMLDERESPDIEAKLAGLQTPRGWGLFLIENMVDKMKSGYTDEGHQLELIFDWGEKDHAKA